MKSYRIHREMNQDMLEVRTSTTAVDSVFFVHGSWQSATSYNTTSNYKISRCVSDIIPSLRSVGLVPQPRVPPRLLVIAPLEH